MKIFYSILFLFFFGCSFSQKNNQIISLKPESLLHKILGNNKPAIIQFWNPNCENVKNILKEYKLLEKKYSNTIDFYFIGITNRQSLVVNDLKVTNYNYKIYIIDVNFEKEILKRKERFTKEISKILKIKSNDFITLVLNKNHKVIYQGDLLKIEPYKFKEFNQL